jgi:hypothetical protein
MELYPLASVISLENVFLLVLFGPLNSDAFFQRHFTLRGDQLSIFMPALDPL